MIVVGRVVGGGGVSPLSPLLCSPPGVRLKVRLHDNNALLCYPQPQRVIVKLSGLVDLIQLAARFVSLWIVPMSGIWLKTPVTSDNDDYFINVFAVLCGVVWCGMGRGRTPVAQSLSSVAACIENTHLLQDEDLLRVRIIHYLYLFASYKISFLNSSV